MFTGDRSGDFLYPQLYRAGFASQPKASTQNDGLTLINTYIGAVARCAPPGNKPTPAEIKNCLPYLEAEISILQPRAVLALGRIAWTYYLRGLVEQGLIARVSEYEFGHGVSYKLPRKLPRLFGSYHPSQQNTQTGKLTPAMFARVLRNIRRYLGST